MAKRQFVNGQRKMEEELYLSTYRHMVEKVSNKDQWSNIGKIGQQNRDAIQNTVQQFVKDQAERGRSHRKQIVDDNFERLHRVRSSLPHLSSKRRSRQSPKSQASSDDAPVNGSNFMSTLTRQRDRAQDIQARRRHETASPLTKSKNSGANSFYIKSPANPRPSKDAYLVDRLLSEERKEDLQ